MKWDLPRIVGVGVSGCVLFISDAVKLAAAIAIAAINKGGMTKNTIGIRWNM